MLISKLFKPCRRQVLVVAIFFLLTSQSAQALTLQEIINYQTGQGQVLGAATPDFSVDGKGRVTANNAAVNAILGPMLADGVGPWTWFDDRHKALGNFFGGLQATELGYQDDWNTALAGTISVGNGGTTVTGSGTDFKTDFCSGGATPDANVQFVAWHPIGASTGRYPFWITSCDSPTQLTVGAAPFAMTGVAYSKSAQNYGYWINGSTNNNYYDNVLAFYSLYYRTNDATYLGYARTLADRWWTSPWINKCEPQKHEWNASIYHPRVMSLTGMVLRALDGKPEMWAGLEGCFDYYAADLVYRSSMYDLREQAYNVSVVALGAMFDTNPTKQATYIAALENSITDLWTPAQEPNGNWLNPSYGYASWNGYSGTITVTHGSTAVVGDGTSWDTSWFDWSPFWVPEDPVSYTVTWNSATSLTLDRPYEGTTRSGEGWQTSNLVGNGTQPFMMGIVGRAWYYAYQALDAVESASAPTARQFVLDAVDWITDYGYSPTVKGLYYGVDYPSCPTPETSPGCGPDASRYTNAEVLGAYSAAYALTGDAKYKTQGDKLFGAEWGGPSSVGPQADGTYAVEYADGEWTFVTKKAKNFGFGFGFGGGPTWPAARLGTSLDPQKYPRLITLTSLEGISAIPANQPVTATVLSGSTILETQNLVPNASKQYAITFLSTDPQLVNIRIKATGYLSQSLTNIDTTVSSASALTVPQLLAGDLNNDNTINALDYSVLNSHWNQNYPTADINQDRLVNSLDFAVLKNNFNKTGQ